MSVQSPTKKKEQLMHIDSLSRFLSGALYWFRGLTAQDSSSTEGESPLAGLMHNCTPH